jgi:hypothetical protein
MMVTISDLVVEMAEKTGVRGAHGLKRSLPLINGLFDTDRSRVPVSAIADHLPVLEIGTADFEVPHFEEPM